MRYTKKDIEKMMNEGKIKGFEDHVQDSIKTKNKLPVLDSKEKTWLKWQLWYWCEQRKLTLLFEHRFHVERRFRIDFFVKEIKCGIEYEGIYSEKSRHTQQTGYSTDCIKYNLAAQEEIIILRYTASNYKQVLTDLNKIYDAQQRTGR